MPADTRHLTAFVELGHGAIVGRGKRDNSLIISQEFATNLDVKINLGVMTKAKIEGLQASLERLKVHAVE